MLAIESRVGLTRTAWFWGTAFGAANLMVATSKVGFAVVWAARRGKESGMARKEMALAAQGSLVVYVILSNCSLSELGSSR
jgi:hypothetical protein